MKNLFSYGGGRQGVAICALVIQGRLPHPDAIVIADTNREKSSTWQYMAAYTQPALRQIGLEIEIAPHSLSKTDLLALNGKTQMPLYTRPAGKLPTFCSHEWKRRVVQRWCRQKWPGEDVKVWIGFSTDEINRVGVSNEKWYQHHFPLIEDVRLSAADCMSVARRMGWPPPPRSSCYMCPHMSDQEWRELPMSEFEKAARVEEQLQAADPNVYLHRARVPLREVNLTAQKDLFEDTCKSGYCFT